MKPKQKANSKDAKEKAIEQAEKFIDRIYKEGLQEDFADKNIIVSIIEKLYEETQAECEVMKTKSFQDTKNSDEFLREKIKRLEKQKEVSNKTCIELAKQNDKLQQENTEKEENILEELNILLSSEIKNIDYALSENFMIDKGKLKVRKKRFEK